MKKKLLAIMFTMFLVIFTSGMAFGGGSFDINASSMGGAIDGDFQGIPNGYAGGISGAGGIAGADANGGICWGDVSGEINAWGGGLTNTEAYRLHPNVGDRSIGVGSSSESYAVTGADANLHVKGFLGAVGADINGIAGQGTLNGSTLGESPLFFSKTEGRTCGIAGQFAIGGFEGEAYAGDSRR